ncbi:MAG: hypothetical protein ACREYC_16140 [Gammaproteobacteria bacterium]
MEQVFGGVGRPVSIRAVGRGAFPAITIGNRPHAIEVWALAPSIDASKLEISIDRGLLTIAGAIPITGLTAIQEIDDALHAKKGEAVIIHGAVWELSPSSSRSGAPRRC